MPDYMTLMGAEDVRAAGNAMASAAREMLSAASTIDGAMERQRQFLDDWMTRFEFALASMKTEQG